MNMPAVCGEAAATAAIAVLRLVPGSGRVPFTAAGGWGREGWLIN